MIKKIYIENFKCFEKEEIEFSNLTVLTGENSSGKSSLIQAILLLGNPPTYSNYYQYPGLANYFHSLGSYASLANKFLNAKNFKIKAELDNGKVREMIFSNEKLTFPNGTPDASELRAFSNLFYLNADRIKPQSESQLMEDAPKKYFGIRGEFISSFFYLNKSNTVENYLIKDESSYTLETQVNYWLKYITDIENIEFFTEKSTPNTVKSFYKIEGFEFFPENIGSGVSYLLTMLIVCLSAKKGNIIIIENPEIHLHPKSQAKLGEFFSFIAAKDIQLIIETHNDHIINRICYEEFKENIKSKDIVIQYKENSNTQFQKIEIKKGQFFNKKGENRFPEGFFDATLKEIFEING
jgi:predicted ATPase